MKVTKGELQGFFSIGVLVLFVALPTMAETVLYTFEQPEFVLGDKAPYIDKPPNSGTATFLASFISNPSPDGFFVIPVALGPPFSGQGLMGEMFGLNTLTLTLNRPVTDVQVDFALVNFPGRLELHSSVGRTTAATFGSTGIGSLNFHSDTGFTEFELLGFDNQDAPNSLAIDNLQMTVVPEAGSATLALLGLGVAGWRAFRKAVR